MNNIFSSVKHLNQCSSFPDLPHRSASPVNFYRYANGETGRSTSAPWQLRPQGLQLDFAISAELHVSQLLENGKRSWWLGTCSIYPQWLQHHLPCSTLPSSLALFSSAWEGNRYENAILRSCLLNLEPEISVNTDCYRAGPTPACFLYTPCCYIRLNRSKFSVPATRLGPHWVLDGQKTETKVQTLTECRFVAVQQCSRKYNRALCTRINALLEQK